MFRRETIIALRARHQAYRIASDIMNPHADVPPPPQPAIPIDVPEVMPYRRRTDTTGLIAIALIWGLVVVYWVGVWLMGGK